MEPKMALPDSVQFNWFRGGVMGYQASIQLRNLSFFKQVSGMLGVARRVEKGAK